MTPELHSSLPRWGLLAGLLALLSGCSADFHASKGREALDAHELSRAEKQFRKALDKDPKSADALSGLGWTYQISGRREAAQGAFQKCLETLPEEVSCLRGMASVQLSSGNPAAATELLAKALALAPEDPGVQGSQAILEMTQNNLDQAAGRYKALLERYPSMAEYRLGYAEVLLRQKKAEEALAMVDQALALPDTPLRFQSMLYMLKARALVAATSGRVNPKDCASTAPPVMAWLDAAEASLQSAKELGIGTDITQVQRLVARRRGAVEDRCPGLASAAGAGGLPELGPAQPSTLRPPPLRRAGEENDAEGAEAEEAAGAEEAAPTPPAAQP